MNNKVNYKKLLNSKWTALRPVNKEKHFIVDHIERNLEDPQLIDFIRITACLTRQTYQIKPQDLKNPDKWMPGWH
jgi:tryptophan-rich hypothetical protein